MPSSTSCRLAFTVVATLAAASAGCMDSESEERSGEGASAAFRTDPHAVVPTTGTGVELLSGYNAFLDAAGSMRCVEGEETLRANVTDIRSELYIVQVSSREELAKELDVDVSASVKLPRASADASMKLVKSMKRTSNQASYVVRARRSYAVSPRGRIRLTEGARAVLETGNTSEFLRKCGGSFVSSLRYEGQVVGLLTFETSSEESAKSVKTAVGIEGKAAVSGGVASLESKFGEIATKNRANLSLNVIASGFTTEKGIKAEDATENTLRKIDELRGELEKSIDRNATADRDGYFANGMRAARAVQVTQASYGQLENAPPQFNYQRLTVTLTRAEEFFLELATAQLRMEAVHTDEIQPFLSDPEAFRYNVTPRSKTTTEAVRAVARRWATPFRPDGTTADGSLVEPLRMHNARCLASAAAGTYESCTTDVVIEGDVSAATKALAAYGKEGRLARLVVAQPTKDTMSHYRASGVCEAIGMRLPRVGELQAVAPVAAAWGGELAEVWAAADASCAKPFLSNPNGEAAVRCAAALTEPAPFVDDKRTICVGLSGPLPTLAAP